MTKWTTIWFPTSSRNSAASVWSQGLIQESLTKPLTFLEEMVFLIIHFSLLRGNKRSIARQIILCICGVHYPLKLWKYSILQEEKAQLKYYRTIVIICTLHTPSSPREGGKLLLFLPETSRIRYKNTPKAKGKTKPHTLSCQC